MSEWTPGPWVRHQSHIYAPDGAIIAQIHNPGRREQDYPLAANGDLIAAAPEMAELLEQWQTDAGYWDERAWHAGGVADKTRALLGRIRGEDR